ncbi:hypothetical protein ACFLIM_33535 [Nonomuraea sp. M3C6]|uniref:Intradiol ring-cleavage dioxygenases domain-containing protein n=1 Tax=Nonomuraea marmarensis TaxID=3351344 RepID=A0ABW7APV7_9ACTN
MAPRHRLPHPHRTDQQPDQAGVHPALGHPRRLQRGGPAHQLAHPRHHPFSRARPVLRRGTAAARARRRHRRRGFTDTEGTPLAGAVVDVWQSNDDGFYDVQLPDLDGPVLRARFTSDDDGRLTFWTILPVAYPIPDLPVAYLIPDDGPVGQLLKDTGRHPYRAPHLHFMISAPGMRTLVTQLFVAGGDYIDGDTVFGVKDELIVDLPAHKGPTPDGRPVNGPWRRVDYIFRLAVVG